MKVELNRLNEDYHFELKNERGHIIHLDNKAENGGHDLGASPMELLLMGVAGCSAIDIIMILKKQKQEITSYKTEVNGVRQKIGGASPFKTIDVIVSLEGDISPEKALRAAELSFEKYCSVSKTLEPTAVVNYKVVVNGTLCE